MNQTELSQKEELHRTKYELKDVLNLCSCKLIYYFSKLVDKEKYVSELERKIEEYTLKNKALQ